MRRDPFRCRPGGRWVVAALLGALLPALWALGAQAGDGLTTVAGVYTKAQARSGKALYERHCLVCHDNGYFRSVLKRYHGQPVAVLFDVMSGTMPESNPGGLRDDEYLAILAYLFSRSRYPAGERPLALEDLPAVTIEDSG